jgi:hypothetical protein
MFVSAVLAGAGAFALLAPAASAQTADPTVDTTPPATDAPVTEPATTTTLPLFGIPLTVDVSTTPGGSLADVTVNPADGLTATKVHPNLVAFVNDAGTGKVRVVTRHGNQKTAVAAPTLADITGAGHWSGDLFGTGTTTTVDFQIADRGDGTPDITGIGTSDASAVIGDVQHSAGDKVARATITFTSGIQSRRLTITVVVFTRGDETRAASQVSLSKISGVKLPADQAAGEHTWSGMLCDGTKASVTYTVAADGSITAGAVTPAGATTAVKGNTLAVRFSDTESVSIRVRESDGQLRISASPRLRCERTVPSVNTPTSTNATNRDPRSGPPRVSSSTSKGDGPWSRDGRNRGDH